MGVKIFKTNMSFDFAIDPHIWSMLTMLVIIMLSVGASQNAFGCTSS